MSLLLALIAGAAMRTGPVVGDRIEPFTIERSEGGSFHWTPGRATVLCLCAFWCDTWKDQLPRVLRASRDLKGLPVDFLTVSVDGRWSERGRAAAVGLNLSDPGGRWTGALGFDRIPYTLLLDSKGVVRWAAFGVLRSQDLVDSARAALHGPPAAGTVYLTFDDFPAEHGSDELLDALRAAHVQATFFCVCSRAGQYARVMKRAVDEGHRLQIHAWNHDEREVDLARCKAALGQFGPLPDLFRPAGSEQIFTLDHRALGLHVVDPYDYTRPGAEELVRRVTQQVQGGGVIQLHAGVGDTLSCLPGLAERLRERGFTFNTLGA